MTDEHLALNDFEFRKTPVDPAQIEEYSSEGQFLSLSVELFKEIGQVTAILSCTYHTDGCGGPRK